MFPAKLSVLVVIICISHNAFSMKEDDLSGWLTADITVNKNKWSHIGCLEYRGKNYMKEPDLYSLGVYSRYKFTSFFRASVGYELFLTNYERGMIWEHRLMAQGEFFLHVRNIYLDNRLSLLNDFETLNKPGWGARDRIKIRYPVKSFSPYVFFEPYFKYTNERVRHSKSRYALGVAYALNAQHTIDLYYMAEDYMLKSFTNHVIGIVYSFSI